ncbi:hypothetical protein TMM008_05940 [Pseudomonas sp. 008]|nr:hypothetical protein TMM008_05940 [Pseudomonas sp. 008]
MIKYCFGIFNYPYVDPLLAYALAGCAAASKRTVTIRELSTPSYHGAASALKSKS